MTRKYILDCDVEQPDVAKWAQWLETNGCRVAVDFIGESKVSTVFLAIDYDFDGDGPPLLYETLVFGGPLDGEMDRYSTKAEAQAGHAEMLARVAAASKKNIS